MISLSENDKKFIKQMNHPYAQGRFINFMSFICLFLFLVYPIFNSNMSIGQKVFTALALMLLDFLLIFERKKFTAIINKIVNSEDLK